VDTTHLFPGAKRLTTSGFSKQRPAANKFAAALLLIRGDYKLGGVLYKLFFYYI